jgi:hypothetical protein
MKRLFFTAAFVLFLIATSTAQTPVVTQIELTKQSRGYQEAIRITADSIFVVAEDLKNGKPAIQYSHAIADGDWTKLVSSIGSLKLKDIPSLSSPTMKRASDAAMHSTLTITTNDGNSYAHGYDDENPHESLQQLRKSVREVSGKKE